MVGIVYRLATFSGFNLTKFDLASTSTDSCAKERLDEPVWRRWKILQAVRSQVFTRRVDKKLGCFEMQKPYLRLFQGLHATCKGQLSDWVPATGRDAPTNILASAWQLPWHWFTRYAAVWIIPWRIWPFIGWRRPFHVMRKTLRQNQATKSWIHLLRTVNHNLFASI